MTMPISHRDAPPNLSCPRCGAAMIIAKGPRGEFYGCSRFKAYGCSGSMSIPPSADDPPKPMQMSSVSANSTTMKSLGEILQKNLLQNVPQKQKIIDDDLVRAISAVALVCGDKFDSVKDAENWLSTGKVALKGRSPLSFMDSVSGCEKVVELIRGIWD